MYQNIDFSKTGGFPLTQNAMGFLQNSYNQVFASLTNIIGTYGIISGVTLSLGNYSDGWVTFNGEIVPFIGAPVSQGPNVSIQETIQSVTYRDTGVKGVIITRKAVLGATGIPFSNFTRITLQQLNSAVILANSNAISALNIANNALTIANNALTTANTALATAGAAAPTVKFLPSELTLPTVNFLNDANISDAQLPNCKIGFWCTVTIDATGSDVGVLSYRNNVNTPINIERQNDTGFGTNVHHSEFTWFCPKPAGTIGIFSMGHFIGSTAFAVIKIVTYI